MTRAAPNFAHIVHKPMPKHEIEFELEPLAPTHRGFESRPAPLTVDELRAAWSAERARAVGAS